MLCLCSPSLWQQGAHFPKDVKKMQRCRNSEFFSSFFFFNVCTCKTGLIVLCWLAHISYADAVDSSQRKCLEALCQPAICAWWSPRRPPVWEWPEYQIPETVYIVTTRSCGDLDFLEQKEADLLKQEALPCWLAAPQACWLQISSQLTSDLWMHAHTHLLLGIISNRNHIKPAKEYIHIHMETSSYAGLMDILD